MNSVFCLEEKYRRKGWKEEEEEESSEEEQESSNVSRASKRSGAASADEEEENDIATSSRSSQEDRHGKRRRIIVSEDEDQSEDDRWIPTALATIDAVNSGMLQRSTAWIAHSSPKSFLPDLERVRKAATLLVRNTDTAISSVRAQQNLLDKKALQAELATVRQELAQSMERSATEHRKQTALLQQVKAQLVKERDVFRKEKEFLENSHKSEKEALVAVYTKEQHDLRRQLEEERDKSICCVCHDKPRDTIILPCLHFQYCFSCLLRHREVNSNTCPTCRGPIQGLNMSIYLAAQ